MKRFTTILLTLAICVGVFAPVVIAFDKQGEASFTALSAYADTATTSTDTAVQLAADPSANISSCVSWSGVNAGACIAWVVYYIPYDIGEWFMGVAARTFDIAASFTLSSKLYTSGSFLQQGWQVTRDFANIFFILILLFIALSLVLDIEVGHANPKKMLATLVMVALVINFSFFITEVVIDVSNSLALVFYNQVTVIAKATDGSTVVINDKDVNDQLNSTQGTGVDSQGNKVSVQYIENEKPLSIALVQAMKPQVLTDQTFYNKLCSDDFYATPSGNTVKCNTGNASNSGTLIALFLIVGVMYIIVGYCFIVALGSLFGRMISLFIAIVFAPLAFISLIVPSMAHQPGFGWDEWFGNLMKNAFAAPIFFFFILLISILSKTSVIPDAAGLQKLSAGIILLLVTIQFMILITMMLAAVKYVKSASGAIGDALGGVAGKLVKGLGGIAVGTAAGTVALAGSKTLGAAGNRIANSEWATKLATNKNNAFARFAGEKAIKLGQGASKASFNVAPALGAITGLNTDSFGALSQKRSAGGFQARSAYKAKKDTDFANTLKENQTQAAAIKKLKEGREKEVSEIEGKLFQLEADENEFKAQKTRRKDAEDLMNSIKKQAGTSFDPSNPGYQYEAALKEFMEAEAKLNGQRDAKTGKPVLDAEGNPVDSGLRERSESNRKTIADLKTELNLKKIGELDENGKPKVYEEGEGWDGKTGNPKFFKADGTPVMVADEGRVRTESLSIKDLEGLMESNKKANTKAYLYNQAVASGYHVHADHDKLGNVKSFHVDTTKKDKAQVKTMLVRTLGQSLLEGGFGAALGATVGSVIAPGIGTAIGAKIGAMGGIPSFLTEVHTGHSYTDAEAAHHTAEPHDAHGGHGHDDHGHGGGVLSNLVKDLTSAFKGLGGGGGGGGGGGHGGGGGGGHH